MIYNIFEKEKKLMFFVEDNEKNFLIKIQNEIIKLYNNEDIYEEYFWDFEIVNSIEYKRIKDEKNQDKNIDLTILKIEEDEDNFISTQKTTEYAEAEGLLKKILNESIRKHASDIHVYRIGDNLIVKLRIEGQLITIISKYDVNQKLQKRLIALLRNRAAGINSLETRKPGSGKIKIKWKDTFIDVRVEIVNTGVNNETEAVMRLLERKTFKKMNELGFNKKDEDFLTKAIREKRGGMILITGATGSGKSTSALTLLKDIRDDEGYNILTAENPVEGEIDGARQFQVNEEQGLTYPILLKSFLRMDPDIIFVGEIRDEETAKIALQASQTGHVVISTLHTSSVLETRNRLKGLGISVDEIEQQLKVIITQRLIYSEKKQKRMMVYEIGRDEVEGLSIEDKINDLYNEGLIDLKEKEVNLCQQF